MENFRKILLLLHIEHLVRLALRGPHDRHGTPIILMVQSATY
jgi:hypothetical protein